VYNEYYLKKTLSNDLTRLIINSYKQANPVACIKREWGEKLNIVGW
jgi:hypothetical protein